MGGVAVATAVLAASPASAKFIGLTISGDQHYVGKTYTVSGTCDRTSSGTFWVNDEPIDNAWPDQTGVAKWEWTPQATGKYILMVNGCVTHEQTPTDVRITVEVTTAPAGGTGSAGSIPIIGGLLSSLSAK